MKRTALLIIFCVLAFLIGGCETQVDENSEEYAFGNTAEYRAFLAIRDSQNALNPYTRTEVSGDYKYVLQNGTLTFNDLDGNELWRSNPYWYVDDFRLFDVDDDGKDDCLFSLWKSYSFYEGASDNDDPSVKNHLFLYTIRGKYGKALWASSNLPRPIHSFEISEGVRTVLSNGAVLETVEGEYTDDFSKSTLERKHRYVWEGWGFVEEDSATISFVGDLMVHGRQLLEAYDAKNDVYTFDYSFSEITEYISSSDYSIGNLETVLGGKALTYSDYPFFNTPNEFAVALKNAGFDLLTTANNHAFDKGELGVANTIDALDSIGIDHIGTGEDKNQNLLIREINGIRFAFLSYTYGVNVDEAPHLISVMSEEKITADLTRAKVENPDVIIVLPHMGDEYAKTPSDEWTYWAHFMINSGADVVVANHPHVVQPIERLTADDGRECLVAYSLGNFISSQRDVPTDEGVILNLTFTREAGKVVITDVECIPTWVKFVDKENRFDIKVVPVRETLDYISDNTDHTFRDADIMRLREILDGTTD